MPETPKIDYQKSESTPNSPPFPPAVIPPAKAPISTTALLPAIEPSTEGIYYFYCSHNQLLRSEFCEYVLQACQDKGSSFAIHS